MVFARRPPKADQRQKNRPDYLWKSLGGVRGCDIEVRAYLGEDACLPAKGN